MSDDNQLDNVDKRKLVEDKPHQDGEWTEIGEAEVTVDIFGHAKVHVIRQHDQARRNWIIAGICLVLLAVVTVICWGVRKSRASLIPCDESNYGDPSTCHSRASRFGRSCSSHCCAPPVVRQQPKPVVRATPHPVSTPLLWSLALRSPSQLLSSNLSL